MNEITSRQNPLIIRVSKLGETKFRKEEKLFRFDGVKLFTEAVMKGAEIEYVFVCSDKREKLRERIKELGGDAALALFDNAIPVSEAVFDKISDEKSPEGIITVAKYIDKIHKINIIYNEEDFPGAANAEKIVFLEAIRDPQNLGAIIRSATAFGVDRLVLSSDCADIYNSKTLRAAMGTIFSQRIDIVEDLPDAVRRVRCAGMPVYAAALDRGAITPDRLGEDEKKRGAVVIGNEGHGLCRETIDACDGKIFIPIAEGAESLNAAVAAALLMWIFRK